MEPAPKAKGLRIALLVVGVAAIPVICAGVFVHNSWKLDKLKRRNSLKVIGLALHNYNAASPTAPPRQPEDIQPYLEPTPYAELRTGKFMVVWGASIEKMYQAGTLEQHVLAYEAEVPERGGAVLMADGSVRDMTPAEFQAAKKAEVVPAEPGKP